MLCALCEHEESFHKDGGYCNSPDCDCWGYHSEEEFSKFLDAVMPYYQMTTLFGKERSAYYRKLFALRGAIDFLSNAIGHLESEVSNCIDGCPTCEAVLILSMSIRELTLDQITVSD